MRNNAIPLLIGTLLLLPAAAIAQVPPGGLDSQPSLFNTESVLEYRLALDEITSIYEELATRLSKNESVSTLGTLVTKAERMTDSDLAMWMEGGVDLQGLLSALRDLRDQLDQNESNRSVGGGLVTKTAGFPNASYSAICGSERGNTDLEFAAKVALQIAKGVWAAASRACDETVAGFNTSLACIIADEILFVAEAILEDFFFCDDSVNAAEIEGSYERLGHLHGDMEALQADVSLDMKLMIEQNLMIISPNQIIVSYSLPATSGGLLDFVVTVIEETIQDALRSGMAINFAQSFFDQAEVLRADASYKRAFLMYRRAYQEVARLP